MAGRGRLVCGLVAVMGVSALLVPTAAQAGVNAAWSPSGTYDFGLVSSGTTVAKTFHLTNSGSTKTAPLRIAFKQISGAFVKTRDTCKGLSLAKGKSCLVRVAYTPGSSGSDSATLIALNQQDTVTYATVSLTGHSGEPNIVITPSTSGAFDFGPNSGTQSFDVTNNGTRPAYLDLIGVFGGDANLSLVLNDVNDFCGLVSFTPLDPGQTCPGAFTATFTLPGTCSTTTHSGTLEVDYGDDSSFDNPQKTIVSVSGEDTPCP